MYKKIIFLFFFIVSLVFGNNTEIKTEVVDDNPIKEVTNVKLRSKEDKKINLSVRKLPLLHLRESDTDAVSWISENGKIGFVGFYIPSEGGDLARDNSKQEHMIFITDNRKKLPGKIVIDKKDTIDKNGEFLKRRGDISPLTSITDGHVRIEQEDTKSIAIKDIDLQYINNDNDKNNFKQMYKKIWEALNPDLVNKPGHENDYLNMKAHFLGIGYDTASSRLENNIFTLDGNGNPTIVSPNTPWYDDSTVFFGVYTRAQDDSPFGIDSNLIKNINDGKWELKRVYQWDKPGYNIRLTQDEMKRRKHNARPDFPIYVGAGLPGFSIQMNSEWRNMYPEWQITDKKLIDLYRKSDPEPFTIRVELLSGRDFWPVRYTTADHSNQRKRSEIKDDFKGLSVIKGGQRDTTGTFFRDDKTPLKDTILLTHEFEIQTWLGYKERPLIGGYTIEAPKGGTYGKELQIMGGAPNYTGAMNPPVLVLHVYGNTLGTPGPYNKYWAEAFHSRSLTTALWLSYFDEATSVYELFKIFPTGLPKAGLYTYRRNESDRKVEFLGLFDNEDNTISIQPWSFSYNGGKFWFLIQRAGKKDSIYLQSINNKHYDYRIPREILDDKFDYGIDSLGKKPVGLKLKVNEIVKKGAKQPANINSDERNDIIISQNTKTGIYNIEVLAQVEVRGVPADYLQKSSSNNYDHVKPDPDQMEIWYSNPSPKMTARVDLNLIPNGTEMTWTVPDEKKDGIWVYPRRPVKVSFGEWVQPINVNPAVSPPAKPELQIQAGEWWDIWDNDGNSQLNMVEASESFKSSRPQNTGGENIGNNLGGGQKFSYDRDGFAIRFYKDGKFVITKSKGKFLRDRYYNFNFLANPTKPTDNKRLELGALTLQVKGDRPIKLGEYEYSIDGRVADNLNWIQVQGGAGKDQENLDSDYKPFILTEHIDDVKLPTGVNILRWVGIADRDVSNLDYQIAPNQYQLRQNLQSKNNRPHGVTKYGNFVNEEFEEESIAPISDLKLILPDISNLQSDLKKIAEQIKIKNSEVVDGYKQYIIFEGTDGKYYQFGYQMRSDKRKINKLVYETDLNDYQLNIPYKYTMTDENITDVELTSTSNASQQQKLTKVLGTGIDTLSKYTFDSGMLNNFKLKVDNESVSGTDEVITEKYKLKLGFKPMLNSVGIKYSSQAVITKIKDTIFRRDDKVLGTIFYKDVPITNVNINLSKSKIIEIGDIYLESEYSKAVAENGNPWLLPNGTLVPSYTSIPKVLGTRKAWNIDYSRSTVPTGITTTAWIDDTESEVIHKDKVNIDKYGEYRIFSNNDGRILFLLPEKNMSIYAKFENILIDVTNSNNKINTGSVPFIFKGNDGTSEKIYLVKIHFNAQNTNGLNYILTSDITKLPKGNRATFNVNEKNYNREKDIESNESFDNQKLNLYAKLENATTVNTVLPIVEINSGTVPVIKLNNAYSSQVEVTRIAQHKLKIVKKGYYEIELTGDPDTTSREFAIRKLSDVSNYDDVIDIKEIDASTNCKIRVISNNNQEIINGAGTLDITSWSDNNYTAWEIVNGEAKAKDGINKNIRNTAGVFPALTSNESPLVSKLVIKDEHNVELGSVSASDPSFNKRIDTIDNGNLTIGVYGIQESTQAGMNIPESGLFRPGWLYIKMNKKPTFENKIIVLEFYKQGSQTPYGKYTLTIVNDKFDVIIEGDKIFDFGYVQNTIPQPSNGIILEEVTKTEDFSVNGAGLKGKKVSIEADGTQGTIKLKLTGGSGLPLEVIPVKDIKVTDLGAVSLGDNGKFKVTATAVIRPKLKPGEYWSDKPLNIIVKIKN